MITSESVVVDPFTFPLRSLGLLLRPPPAFNNATLESDTPWSKLQLAKEDTLILILDVVSQMWFLGA